MDVKSILSKSVDDNKCLSEDINELNKISTEAQFISYLERNINNCFKYYKYSIKEKDLDKKYIYCKYYAYNYYNVFMYIKEYYMNEFLLKKYTLEDITNVGNYYISPLNYTIYMTNQKPSAIQSKFLDNLVSTEDKFILPKINLNLSKISEDLIPNKELYNLYVSFNRIEGFYYKFHELILSKALDKLEPKLVKKYKTNIKEIRGQMVRDYDIEGFRR